MVQPATKRLVTEQKLADTIASEVPKVIKKQQTRVLGDQFKGIVLGSVPLTKAVVSLHTAVDGTVTGTPTYIQPETAYDIAECNWNPDTLIRFSTLPMNLSKSHDTGCCFDFTTMFEGSYLVIGLYAYPGVIQDLRVWIDDQEVRDWYLGTRASGVLNSNKPEIRMPSSAGAGYYLNINFPTRDLYKVRVSGPSFFAPTMMLAHGTDGKVHKPATQRVFGVISDSWYDTIAATNTSLNAGVELSARTGWKQWNLAVGGSGFVNASPQAGGPHNYSSDKVFAALAKAPPMDLLILNGSVNDLGYSEADVLNAMQTFFDRWRTVRPDTPIVWQGLEPQSYFEGLYTPAAIIAREEAQRVKAAADPSVIGCILPSKESWLTGTGNTSAPNGTGNQDWVTGPDGVHLSPYGCRLNGILVAERLASIPTWRGV